MELRSLGFQAGLPRASNQDLRSVGCTGNLGVECVPVQYSYLFINQILLVLLNYIAFCFIIHIKALPIWFVQMQQLQRVSTHLALWYRITLITYYMLSYDLIILHLRLLQLRSVLDLAIDPKGHGLGAADFRGKVKQVRIFTVEYTQFRKCN